MMTQHRTVSRGLDVLPAARNFLDHSAKGRDDEDDLSFTMERVRLRDQYGKTAAQ